LKAIKNKDRIYKLIGEGKFNCKIFGNGSAGAALQGRVFDPLLYILCGSAVHQLSTVHSNDSNITLARLEA
jgi:hypothetical protein